MPAIAAALSCPKNGLLSVFITNLGKYNEGELVGEWVSLPTTRDEIKACFKRIGVDGVKYEEYFLTDYESALERVTAYIEEYTSLDELNYLACQLETLSSSELEHYQAIVEMGDISSLKALINLVGQLDCYQYLSDIHNEYDLGYYWIEESGCYDISTLGNLANYLDYDKLGRDIALEQGGVFTANGYIYQTDDRGHEEYDGKLVPCEYRVLSE
ncbi:antirestriction protein ArdA [Orbus mooreae]|uniref:antirestriction protein ArdA n=1 Tax=Orbus mooreae TaxID=3074107 RepID=UPI00370DD671